MVLRLTAVVCGAELVLGDVFGCGDQGLRWKWMIEGNAIALALTSQTCSGVSTAGLRGSITPTKATFPSSSAHSKIGPKEGDTHLLNPIRILPNPLPDLLQHFLFILLLLRSKLNQEITRVHLEHTPQQLGVLNFFAMDAITIATRTGVDTDVGALRGGESVEESVW